MLGVRSDTDDCRQCGSSGRRTGAGRFGNDPWWIILIKALAVFVFLMLCVLMMIMADRKVMGRMQQRHGPNRFGPWGLLQSLADGVKLSLKEDSSPAPSTRSSTSPPR